MAILNLLITCLALLWSSTLAQNTWTNETIYVNPMRTIEGNYSGPLRPQVHFSPPRGFANDPNGLHRDAKGIWHLYYQYNPTGLTAGNVHWGHATSLDLYTWQNQPIAIAPDLEGEQIFSGSAVLDPQNTSGLFPNQTDGVVAIYTLLNPSGEQTQDLAYSRDGGYTFTKYKGNPVLAIGSSQFRDPKVIWHAETHKWVMVLAFSQDFTIGIYTSPDLKAWTHASNFTHAGLLGLQWECPNMVQMPVEGSNTPMWLMYISINPGAPPGGSIGQYFPGHFNGTHFIAVDAAARIADFGKDNYAGQFFSGIPGTEKQVSIAWASNWQYCNDVPTDTEGFRSVFTSPRVNYLKNLTRIGYDMVSVPYDISSIKDKVLASSTSLNHQHINVNFANTTSHAIYFEVNVTNLSPSKLLGSIRFSISSAKGEEYIEGGTMIDSGDAWLSRRQTNGFENPFFTDKFSTTGIYGGEGKWSIAGMFDRSILELWLNGGEQSGTMVFYSKSPLTHLRIATRGTAEGVQVDARVWGLRSTWT